MATATTKSKPNLTLKKEIDNDGLNSSRMLRPLKTLARLTSTGYQFWYIEAEAGRLPHKRIGGRIMVSQETILKIADEGYRGTSMKGIPKARVSPGRPKKAVAK